MSKIVIHQVNTPNGLYHVQYSVDTTTVIRRGEITVSVRVINRSGTFYAHAEYSNANHCFVWRGDDAPRWVRALINGQLPRVMSRLYDISRAVLRTDPNDFIPNPKTI